MVDLKKEREKSGLSQEELAEKAMLTRKSISHYENGRRRPSVETAQIIAKVLGFDWTNFYTDSKT